MPLELPWFLYRNPQQRLEAKERFNLYKADGALKRQKAELERLYLSS